MKIAKTNLAQKSSFKKQERQGIAEFLLKKLGNFEMDRSITADEAAMLCELRSKKWKNGGRWKFCESENLIYKKPNQPKTRHLS